MKINNAPQIVESAQQLRIFAETLTDIEKVKTATDNRLRSLTRSVEDSDGVIRGFGMDESVPVVAQTAAMSKMFTEAEAVAIRDLETSMRQHPLGGWVMAQKGVGLKQGARLLAVVGDPYWRAQPVVNKATEPVLRHSDGVLVQPGEVMFPEGPRSVTALWAMCGLHVRDDGSAAKRTKGQQSNWSVEAKTRAWLIIETCSKQLKVTCKTGESAIRTHVENCECSPYRIIIDERRKHTLNTHPDWTPGHSKNDAFRFASKRLLRDLWLESKRIHEGGEYVQWKPRPVAGVVNPLDPDAADDASAPVSAPRGDTCPIHGCSGAVVNVVCARHLKSAAA